MISIEERMSELEDRVRKLENELKIYKSSYYTKQGDNLSRLEIDEVKRALNEAIRKDVLSVIGG